MTQAQDVIRTLTGYDGELVQLMLGQSDPNTALPAWFVADLAVVVPMRLADKPTEKKA